MKLTRRQVKVLIDLAKSRKEYNYLYVENNHLYVTNGHSAIQVKLQDALINGKYDIVPLVTWYKLASTKDTFDTNDITNRVCDSNINIGRFFSEDTTSLSYINFDYKLFNKVVSVFTHNAIKVSFNGEHKPMTITSELDEGITAIVLPMRIPND